MIKLSQREQVLTEEEYNIKNIIDDKISYLNINEKWNEFIEEIHKEVNNIAEEYSESEYKKTDNYKKIKMLEEQWNNLKKTNQLTDEKERVLSEQLDKLENEGQYIIDELERKVSSIKNMIISEIIKSKTL